VYGVMAYTVSLRKREIGVRMALGARQRDVVTLVLGEGLRVVAIGAVCGLLAGIGAAKLMSSSLYGINAYDPITFIVVPLLLSAVAIFATYLPARHAAAVDPAHALRVE
jgi:putative ABC transport system permease protein